MALFRLQIFKQMKTMKASLTRFIKRPPSAFKKKYKALITEEIKVFVEKPCTLKFGKKSGNLPEEDEASDLFSLFTADIIKKHKIFVR